MPLLSDSTKLKPQRRRSSLQASMPTTARLPAVAGVSTPIPCYPRSDPEQPRH